MIHNFLRLYFTFYSCKILAIFPVLYNMSLQLLLYTIVCVSVPTPIFSLLLSPFPLVTTFVLCICESASLLLYSLVFCFQIPRRSDVEYSICLSLFDISVRIISSSSNHVVANGKFLFFVMAEQYSIVYMHMTSLSSHLLMDTQVASILVSLF